MERAPLRPVPRRPSGPVDPELAHEAVARALPGLDERAAAALALVTLSGRNRAEAAGRLGVEEAELAAALATARKALRRTSAPLAASGWCERAEGLISDRLDGALDDTGAARLEVHLRNCERCVEHERRLVQATDALVEAVAEPLPPDAASPPADLRAVGPATADIQVPERPIAVLPFGEPVAPAAESGEAPRAEIAERPAAAAPEQVAEVPLPAAAEPRPARQLAATIAWHALFALAVLLAVATIVVTVIGITGGGL